MSILIIIAKVFATLMLIGGMLGGVLYIYIAQKNPTYGIAVQTIAGVLMLLLVSYGFYYLWIVEK